MRIIRNPDSFWIATGSTKFPLHIIELTLAKTSNFVVHQIAQPFLLAGNGRSAKSVNVTAWHLIFRVDSVQTRANSISHDKKCLEVTNGQISPTVDQMGGLGEFH